MVNVNTMQGNIKKMHFSRDIANCYHDVWYRAQITALSDHVLTLKHGEHFSGEGLYHLMTSASGTRRFIALKRSQNIQNAYTRRDL